MLVVFPVLVFKVVLVMVVLTSISFDSKLLRIIKFGSSHLIELFFPKIVVSLLLLNIERLIPLVRSCGFDIQFSRCKM